MFDQLKQLMEVKKQAEAMKRELDAIDIEATDVDGIRIVISGTQQVKQITIREDLLGADNKTQLESDMVRAVNSAISKSQELGTQKLKDTTGLNLPGF